MSFNKTYAYNYVTTNEYKNKRERILIGTRINAFRM